MKDLAVHLSERLSVIATDTFQKLATAGYTPQSVKESLVHLRKAKRTIGIAVQFLELIEHDLPLPEEDNVDSAKTDRL